MKNFKKLSVLAAAALMAVAFLAAGCGSDSQTTASSDKNVTVTVGATPVPHAEILNEIKPLLAKEGVDLKVVEFTDYVKPNLALMIRNWMPTSSSTRRTSINSTANTVPN